MKKMKNKATEMEKTDELASLNRELNARLGKAQGAAEAPPEGSKRDRSKDQASQLRNLKKKQKKKLRAWKVVLTVFLLLIAAGAGGIFTLYQKGKSSLLKHEGLEDVQIAAPEDAVVEDEGFTVTYNGRTYRRNEAVTSILCLGIDRQALEEEYEVTGENGQADTLFVAALNTETGDMTLINISRDTMADVDIYNVQNEYVETGSMQICLAYAYGDGRELSCENVIKSVSRLLYGMPIDAYAAIDLPAINVLNDAIGGVEVDVLEDLTDWDSALAEGAHVLLQGSQAERYVRSRYSEGEKATLDSNNLRMARQRQYLTNFITKALSQTRKDPTVPLTLYDAATAYMVTDITASEVTYLASLLLQGSFGGQDIVTVPGEVVMGEQYAEYQVDEEALYQIILNVFYMEV